MLIFERLNLVVSFTLIGLALYFIIDLPTRVIEVEFFSLTIPLVASQRLLMALLLGGLAFTGAGMVIRAHPEQRVSYTVPFWVNATLVVMLATLTLALLGNLLAWAIGLVATGLLLWFSILAEYYVIHNHQRYLSFSQLWSQWVSYGLMLAYAIFMHQAQIAPLLRVPAVFLLAWLLATSIFKLFAPPGKGVMGFGVAIGLGLAQIEWAFQFWHLGPIGIGLLLSLIFYVACGLVVNHLQGKLSTLLLIEYSLVGVIGWGVIYRLG